MIALALRILIFAISSCTLSSACALDSKAKDGVEILADSAVMLYGENHVIFSGNVVMTHDDIIVTADEVTCTYRHNSEAASGIIMADGHVKIKMGADQAQGDHGEYDIGKKEIILKNNVKLQQGARSITGSELHYNLHSKIASLSSSDGKPVQAIFENN